MEKAIDLTKVLKPYTKKKLWVALSKDYKEVVGKGKTPKEALLEALKKEVESPTLIQALPDYSGFVAFIK